MYTVSGMRRILFCLVALVIYTAAECSVHRDCGACTGKDGEADECLWCLDKSDKVVVVTPDQPTKYAAGVCSDSCPAPDEKKLFTLGIAKTTVTRTPNADYDPSPGKKFVGLDVTRVDVKLRRQTTAAFNVALKKGPITFSLYFLLDLSASMSSSKEKVVQAAPALPEAFKNDNEEVAPNPFQYGFGSFVDKAIPPFTYDRFESSYAVPTYSYKHDVKISESDDFGNAVKGIELSGNDDDPEGGLDALVQSLYCDDAKWPGPSVPALRLVLFTTDQLSHIAGDGIEAGIRWPAELKCHRQLFFNRHRELHTSMMMNPLERNTECLSGDKCVYVNVIHDYPSIDQIKEALIEKEASVAFVVPGSESRAEPGVRAQYKEFVEVLGEKGLLSDDTLNMIRDGDAKFDETARKVYYDLFRKEPKFNIVNGDEFKKYYTVEVECTEVLEANGGKSVCIRNSQTPCEDQLALLFNCPFRVSAKTGAPQVLPPEPLEATLTSSLFGQFQLAVESSSCQCPSESFFDGLDEKKCNGGILKDVDCGKCNCPPSAKGEYCDCRIEDLFALCPTAKNGLECGGPGRGKCECGNCECEYPYSGEVCACSSECDEPDADKRCGGPGAGVCECSECICIPPQFSVPGREKCDCNLNECMAPGSSVICNGRGSCPCKECECTPPYKGEFCELCDASVGLTLVPPVYCGDDGVCARCSFVEGDEREAGPDTWGCECCFGVTQENLTTIGSRCQWCETTSQCISRVTMNEAKAKKSETICVRSVAEKTLYETADDITTVVVEKTVTYADFNSIEECPPPEPFDATPVIVGTVLGLLALIVLAILLWRLLAYLKDKKEWENYEKDKAKSKWQADNNPIFKSSVAEFENPIFD